MVVAALLLLPTPTAAATGDAVIADPGTGAEDAVAPIVGEEVPPVATEAPAVPDGGAVPPADAGAVIGAVIGVGAIVGPLPALPGPIPDVSALASGCPGAGSAPRRARASTLRSAVHCLVNHARSRNGVRSMHGDGRLARAARNHARDMVHRRYFGHQRIGGRSPAGRARAVGWRGSALGEAIAWGCGRSATPASTVRAWLNSPGHRAILLSGSYGRIGIGLAKRAPVTCRGGATWVLDAGRG